MEPCPEMSVTLKCEKKIEKIRAIVAALVLFCVRTAFS